MDDELGNGSEFRLAKLMSVHAREHHDLELPDVLGDGALLNRLSPLVHVRRTLFDLGYDFAPASQIDGIHSMFPVLELMEILQNRKIPYRRTALAAEHALVGRPDLSLPDSLFREICVASYTYHEGAHAIFYEVACACEGIPHGRRFVEVLLCSEAFAMAFEQYVALLAIADGRRSTALFLAVSAYPNPLDHRRFDRTDPGAGLRLGRLAVAAPIEVLVMLVTAHLVALLRPTAAAGLPGLTERLAAYAGISPAESSVAEHLISIGLHVDYDFRDRTQRNFYAYLGLQSEFEAVRAEPLESCLADGAPMERFLKRAIHSVLGCWA